MVIASAAATGFGMIAAKAVVMGLASVTIPSTAAHDNANP